jgi:ribosomal protein S18 acetylase RimI-like enzyme
MDSKRDPIRFTINDSPTEKEMKIIQKGFEDYNRKHPNGELDIQPPDISLVLRNNDENIVGGVITSMLTGIMHLEVLWVDKKYRGRGLGKRLVLEAERIGREKGYPASSTWTFSFQAPEFYQNIGYEIVGVFEGYVGGITEYVLQKKLDTIHQLPPEDTEPRKGGFIISEDASKDSMKIVHEGLGRNFKENVSELQETHPDTKIKLIIRHTDNRVIGGIHAGTVLGTMYIDYFWIDEKYRRQGYGRDLLMEAERIAKERGCISGQAWVLSFQNLTFFQELGYEIFGVSENYPEPTKEYYLIKRY